MAAKPKPSEQLALRLYTDPDDLPDLRGYLDKTFDYERRVREAAQLYLARRERRTHPDGSWDGFGCWHPSEKERQPCCDGVAKPTPEWPYTLMKHCRSLGHVANKCMVLAKDLRQAAKPVTESADPDDIDPEAYLKGVQEFGFVQDKEMESKWWVTFRGQPVDWYFGEHNVRALVPGYNTLNQTHPFDPHDWQSVYDWYASEKYDKAPQGWSRKWGVPALRGSSHYQPPKRRRRRIREATDPDVIDPQRYATANVETYTLKGAPLFSAHSTVKLGIRYYKTGSPKNKAWAVRLLTEGWPGLPKEVAVALLRGKPEARLTISANDAVIYYTRNVNLPSDRKRRR